MKKRKRLEQKGIESCMGCYASAVFGAARMKEMNSSNGMI